jgi:predicted GTPase
MMREFVVVGHPNSGKTMFTLNFAAFMGSKTLDVTCKTYDGLITCKHYAIEMAKQELCGSIVHKTRALQSITLKAAVGKNEVHFKINDTCGIIEQIHPEEAIRRGMAQTISQLRCADFILHIIDLSTYPREFLQSQSSVDHEIYSYGKLRNGYAILANKIDFPGTHSYLPKIRNLFPQVSIIPISALQGEGFNEVKACVLRNL